MKRLLVAPLMLGILAGGYLVGSLTHGQAPVKPAPAVTNVPKDLASYRDIVKQVLPAVVSLEAKTKNIQVNRKPAQPLPNDPRIPEEFRRHFEEFRQFPDMDAPRQGFGSGFFVDPSGVILTNFHVVDGAESVTVLTHDGRKFTSKNIRGDRRTDLAIVTLDNKAGVQFPYLELGDSDAMEIGDRVLAIGAPFGLAGSVTQGIVSSKGRAGLNMNMYEDFVQTDAAINPGNSGGPLVSLDGKVVGINAAIKSRSGGFQGVGLAVSSNLAKNVVQALRTDGIVQRGYLGVQIRDLSLEIAQRLGLKDNRGVLVGEVFDKSPGAKAGIEAGDIILAIDGKLVKDGKSLQLTVASLPLNKPVDFTIFRDGLTRTLPVAIEAQPDDFGAASVPAPRIPVVPTEAISVGKLGLEIADLNDTLADDLGYRKGTTGVVISKVEPGSVAAEAGLRRGMLINKVDSERVTTAAGSRKLLENASLSRGVLLQVISPTGGVNFVLLKSA